MADFNFTPKDIEHAAVIASQLFENKRTVDANHVRIPMRNGSFNLLLAMLEFIHGMNPVELEEYMTEFRKTHPDA